MKGEAQIWRATPIWRARLKFGGRGSCRAENSRNWESGQSRFAAIRDKRRDTPLSRIRGNVSRIGRFGVPNWVARGNRSGGTGTSACAHFEIRWNYWGERLRALPPATGRVAQALLP